MATSAHRRYKKFDSGLQHKIKEEAKNLSEDPHVYKELKVSYAIATRTSPLCMWGCISSAKFSTADFTGAPLPVGAKRRSRSRDPVAPREKPGQGRQMVLGCQKTELLNYKWTFPIP